MERVAAAARKRSGSQSWISNDEQGVLSLTRAACSEQGACHGGPSLSSAGTRKERVFGKPGQRSVKHFRERAGRQGREGRLHSSSRKTLKWNMALPSPWRLPATLSNFKGSEGPGETISRGHYHSV